MPKATFRKLDVAHEYLTVAAELYFAERYFPALALAAIAEEIFEAVMRARNEIRSPRPPNRNLGLRLLPYKYSPISQELVALVRKLNPALRGLADNEIYRKLYRAKNSSKHGTTKGRRSFDLEIEVDAELESWSMLGRAVENFIRLHYEPQGVIRKFFQMYQSGRRTWHREGASHGRSGTAYSIPEQKPWA